MIFGRIVLGCAIALPQSLFGQGFVYPVGNSNSTPEHAFPNDNGYRISQDFHNPYYNHTGVDLSNKAASGEVRSIGPGVVSFVSLGYSFGFGNVVIIRHSLSDGTFYSLYAHLEDESVLVQEGESVLAGTPIAAVDCTGSCDGAHLHFAVKKLSSLGCGYIRPEVCHSGDTFDNYVSPLQFIADHQRPAPGQSVVLDFETLSSPTLRCLGSDYFEDGFWLHSTSTTATCGFSAWGSNDVAYSGSPALFINQLGTYAELRMISGGEFNVVSIDLARQLDAVTPWVTFEGTLRSGGIVRATVVLLQIASYQARTVRLDVLGFTGLTSLRWQQDSFLAHQFDNIVLQPR